jgi:uncharacterized protein YecE (DUF72 family)
MDETQPGWDPGPFHVGISGWRYPPWRGVFYPSGLAQHRELEHASRVLASIELNGSFYALQRPASYQKWRTQTPAGFVFSVKGPRFVTHMKTLADVTSDFVYVRLHGEQELYVSGYGDEALDRWASRVRAWHQGATPTDGRTLAAPAPSGLREVFVYFDNDVKVHAPFDAIALAHRLGVRDLHPPT